MKNPRLKVKSVYDPKKRALLDDVFTRLGIFPPDVSSHEKTSSTVSKPLVLEVQKDTYAKQ